MCITLLLIDSGQTHCTCTASDDSYVKDKLEKLDHKMERVQHEIEYVHNSTQGKLKQLKTVHKH